jgi:hypothetical protein
MPAIPFQKRDTLRPRESALFEQIPADKAAALVAEIAEWFDSDGLPQPMVETIQAALGVASYPPLDQAMRIELDLMRESRVWEPKRLLAQMVDFVAAIKPPVLPPLAAPAS